MTDPFPIIERSVREVILARIPELDGRAGGSPSYKQGEPPYVWISMIPGAGSTDLLGGSWSLDIDVLAASFSQAATMANKIEAALVGRAHRATDIIFDVVDQNAAPSERPWDDDLTFRVGAVYTFTARRSG